MPILLAVALLVGCLLPLVRVRVPWWQVAALVLGCLTLAWCLWWPTGRERAGWQGALGIGTANAVVPLLLAAADPVRWWRRAVGRPRLQGPVARFLMFPLVAGVLSAVVLTVLYLGGAVRAAVDSDAVWTAATAAALAAGILVALPLLTDDLLPGWVSPPVKAGLAALDGVVDAVPGIVVMTSLDWVVGQTLLAVAELVAVPVLLWVALSWARHDDRDARRLDVELDAEPHDDTPWWEQG